MAENGGTRIGTMIAEIDLDARRYDAGLREALRSAESTTQTVNQAWRRLGTGSSESIDRMRANAVRAYETIRNSGTSSAAEIERAQRAAMARLEQINRRYYGSLTTQMAQTAATSQSMANSIVSSMTSMAGKIYAVYQSFQLVVGEIKAIVDASLRMEAMANAMNAITGSGTLAKDSMEFVSQTANKLGLNLVSLEGAYKNLAGSAMGTSLAGKETEKIFMAVSKASAVLGLSAEQTQGSLYAIGQMMSKGTVQAEELKGQLAERLPGAFQMAAKAMGVTTAELQKMLEKGEVLAVDLIPQLANELDNNFGNAANRAGETARAAFENFGNAVENLRRALESSGIIEFLAEMAERATAVMNSITKLINGPTSDEKIQSNMKRLIELRKEEEKASQSEISAAKERQRISMANSFGGGRSPLPSRLSAGQTVRQKEIETLEKENRLLVEQNKIKQQERIISSNQQRGVADREKQGIELKKANEEAEKAAKKAQSEAERAGKAAAREAEKHAQEMLRIREKAEEDYKKITLTSIDLAKEKIEVEYQERKKAGYEIVKLERWRNAEIQDLESKRLKDFEQGFADERNAYEKRVKDMQDLEEERVKDAQRLLEEQREAYKDFVLDIQDSTSDVILGLFDGGFSSFFDELENKFKRLLADMAAQAIAEPIIVPIVQAIGGGLGESAAKSLGIPFTSSGSGGLGLSSLSDVNTIYNAVTGGLESGVYKALTSSGVLNSVGSSLFGSAAWAGTAAFNPATVGVMAGSQVTAATAAGATAAGTTGIAGMMAAAAPYLAAAAVAIPVVMKMLEDEPEPFLRVQTTSTSKQLSDPNWKWATGEGKSLAGFDYNLTMQDTGGELAKEVGFAVKKMIDAQFTAIEESLNVSINDAIVSAQNRTGNYGEGFFSKVDLRDYENNIEGALKALSDDLFLDIRSELVNQLTDSLGTDGSLFDDDFFKGIAIDGEAAVDTFLRFGQTIQGSSFFIEEFTRRTQELGETAPAAYNMIIALEQMGATITGLTSQSLAQALWESIQQNQGAGVFVQNLQEQVRFGVAQATVNAFSQSLYSAFLQPMNLAIGEMVTQIVQGGLTTGAALSASMATIRESLEAAILLMNSEEFKSLIEEFTTALTASGTTSSGQYAAPIYTPAPIIIQEANIQSPSSDTTPAKTEAEILAEENARKLSSIMDSVSSSIVDAQDSLSDVGLSEYEAKLAAINRETQRSIDAAQLLGASEAELNEIRLLSSYKTELVLIDNEKEIIAQQQKVAEEQAELVKQQQELLEMFYENIISLEEIRQKALGISDSKTADQNLYYELSKLFNVDYAQIAQFNKKELVDAYLSLDSMAWADLLKSMGLEDATDEFAAIINDLVDSFLADQERMQSLLSLQAELNGTIDKFNADFRRTRLTELFDMDFSNFTDSQLVDHFKAMSQTDLSLVVDMLGSGVDEFIDIISNMASAIKEQSKAIAQAQLDIDSAVEAAFGTIKNKSFDTIMAASGIGAGAQNLLSPIKYELTYGAINESQAYQALDSLTASLKYGEIGLDDFNNAIGMVTGNIGKADAIKQYQIETQGFKDSIAILKIDLEQQGKAWNESFAAFKQELNTTGVNFDSLNGHIAGLTSSISSAISTMGAIAGQAGNVIDKLSSSISGMLLSGIDDPTDLQSSQNSFVATMAKNLGYITSETTDAQAALSYNPAGEMIGQLQNTLSLGLYKGAEDITKELSTKYDVDLSNAKDLSRTINAIETHNKDALAFTADHFGVSVDTLKQDAKTMADLSNGIIQSREEIAEALKATIDQENIMLANHMAAIAPIQEKANKILDKTTTINQELQKYDNAVKNGQKENINTYKINDLIKDYPELNKYSSSDNEKTISDVLFYLQNQNRYAAGGTNYTPNYYAPDGSFDKEMALAYKEGNLLNLQEKYKGSYQKSYNESLNIVSLVKPNDEQSYQDAFAYLSQEYSADNISKEFYLELTKIASDLFLDITGKAEEFKESMRTIFDAIFETAASVAISSTELTKFRVLEQADEWLSDLKEQQKEFALIYDEGNAAHKTLAETLDISHNIIDQWVKLKFLLIDIDEMKTIGASRASLSGSSTSWDLASLEGDFKGITNIQEQASVYTKYMTGSWQDIKTWMENIGYSADEFAQAMQTIHTSLKRLQSVNDGKASILGKDYEYQMVKNAVSWGLDPNTFVDSNENQQKQVDLFLNSSAADIVALTDRLGIDTDEFVNAIKEMADHLKTTNKVFEDIVDTLEEYQKTLLSDNISLSPDAVYREKLSSWNANLSDLYSSDPDKMNAAVQKFPSLSNDLLEAGKNTMTDQYEYQALWGKIYAETEKARLYAEEQITQSVDEFAITQENWKFLLELTNVSNENLSTNNDNQIITNDLLTQGNSLLGQQSVNQTVSNELLLQGNSLLGQQSSNQLISNEILLQNRAQQSIEQASLISQIAVLNQQAVGLAKSEDFNLFFSNFSTLFSSDADWVVSLRNAIGNVYTSMETMKPLFDPISTLLTTINASILSTAPVPVTTPAPAPAPAQPTSYVPQYSEGYYVPQQPVVNITVPTTPAIPADTQTPTVKPELSLESRAALLQTFVDLGMNIKSTPEVMALVKYPFPLSYPQYATGGEHSGGWRIVGEKGAELEYTGASRIFNHEDTVAMLRDLAAPEVNLMEIPEININSGTSDNEELIAELKAVKAELQEIKAYNYQQTKLQTKTYYIMDKQDQESEAA